MKLEKITLEEMNVKEQATIANVVEESGRDAAFVGKAVRTANLEPVASINTGKPGRPPRVFNRAELLAAVEAAIQAETEKAAAEVVQTNTEASDTDTQVA